MTRGAPPPASRPPEALSPLLQNGLRFLEAGDAMGAELLLDTYLARHPDDADGQNLMGLAKRRLGQGEAALVHLERAVALSPHEAVYAINFAQALADEGRGEAALAVLDRALAAAPGHADGLMTRALVLQRLGRLEEAVATGKMAVAFHRDLARAYHVLGLGLLKAREFAAAAATLADAVRLDPAMADSWLNRGVALKETGDLAAAEASYRQALTLAPRDALIHNNLANVIMAAGRADEGIALYRTAMALDPTYADAKANLAMALRDAGKADEALTLLAAAAAEHPDHVGILNAYGNSLRQAERHDEAIAVLTRAVELAPDHAEAQNNLGLAYAVKNKLTAASKHMKRAVELKPDMAIISNNYGALLLRMFRFEEAIAALSNAVARDPTYDEALINLGIAHYMRGEPEQAIPAYRRVLERNPDNGFARYSLGVALLEDQRLSEAEVEIRRALELDPKNAMAHNTLGVLLLDQHFVTEARTAMREAADVNTLSAPVFFSNSLFASLYEPDLSNDEIFAAHLEYGRRFATTESDPARPHANPRDPERKLRLAYMSPDFRAHSVAYFMEALIEKHDRRRFSILLYSDTTRTDTVTTAMRGAADVWVETAGLSDEEFAQRIRDDGVDILVDLAGHTSGNRLPVCAVKPAPVQINYMGYPNSTGLPAMDYRITDNRADPIGIGDRYCTEEVIRLPHCFHCYRPYGKGPEVAPAPHLAKGYVTFASFNVLPKVTDPAIAAWAEILKRVPNSRFYIKCKQLRDARVRQRIDDQFARHGIDPNRIAMESFVPSVKDHLAQYALVDLALDTFPYNGTTTTCEAMWMGVPVLTLQSENHRGRVGLSLLTAVDLASEFVAKNVDDYVAKAVALGNNPARLAAIRQELRPRMAASPLRDEVGFTRTLEDVYRNLWRRWCAGPPTTMFKPPPELRPEDSIQGVLIKTL